MVKWRKYKKLIPAVVGIGLLLLLRHYEIEILGLESVVLEYIVSAGTVFGVYQFKNEEGKV